VLPPILNPQPNFKTIAESLDGQAFIKELAIEALRRPVLPRRARIDQGAFYALCSDPFEQSGADEFRSIVAAQMMWCTMYANQLE
jgi:hypothetical protein